MSTSELSARAAPAVSPRPGVRGRGGRRPEVRLQLRDRGPRRRNDFPGLRDRAEGLGQEDGPRQCPSHRVQFMNCHGVSSVGSHRARGALRHSTAP